MSILDIKDLKKENNYILGFSIFILVFGIIYEMFSHGVISYFMIFAFTIPLMNYILNLIIMHNNIKIIKISKNLFSSSILTFTLYSILKGILDIYGTTNSLINIYLAVGILLLVISIFINLLSN